MLLNALIIYSIKTSLRLRPLTKIQSFSFCHCNSGKNLLKFIKDSQHEVHFSALHIMISTVRF